MNRSVLPFGPQHPVLPEPLHLKLTVEDERVVEAVPAFGFLHRGLEKLCEIRDFNQMIQVIERVCGICSKMHALCYCQAIESLMAVEVPHRARYLRLIWSELHRIQSHLLWFGLLAEALGFESLFMRCWKIREKILDINEATTGNRIIVSVNVIGGVRRDLNHEQLGWLLAELKTAARAIKDLEATLLGDYTIQKRTVGKGVILPEQVEDLGLVGPTLRASGIARDTRQMGYAAYDAIDFEAVTAMDGDCFARAKVRYLEMLQSIDLIYLAVARIPQGETRTKVKGRPQGERTMRVEQPRGELFYYIRANGQRNLERLRIRTPTFANIPVLFVILRGAWLSDVPVLLLSIDPCFSCMER
jgi:ech hydrogenase subunit E